MPLPLQSGTALAAILNMTLIALLGCLIIAAEVRYRLSQVRLRRLLRAQEYRLPF